MNLRVSLLAASTLFAIGCGGGPPATVDGSIEGKTLPAVEAISGVATILQNLGPMAVVVASTMPGSCAMFSANKRQKGSQSLIIGLGNVNFAKEMLFPPTGPNSFPLIDLSSPMPTISTSTTSLVLRSKTDENCVTTNTVVGTMGTVTLESAVDLAYEGSGDVTLSTGDHITFSFDSTSCNGLGPGLESETAPVCP